MKCGCFRLSNRFYVSTGGVEAHILIGHILCEIVERAFMEGVRDRPADRVSGP